MTRCAMITILGAPNAGKSTLMNRLAGAKLAITSPRVQTTRHAVRGVVTEGDTQLIFMDTPGLFQAKERFEKAMVDAAIGGMEGADILLFITDARWRPGERDSWIFEALKRRNLPVWLVVNQIDRVDKPSLLEAVAAWNAVHGFAETFLVSALNGEAVDDLKEAMKKAAPEGPFLFPEDTLSDMNERMFAAEVTREKLFMALRQELPYAIFVETERWEEKKDGSVAIHQAILVERENQKKIVLGKGGEMLKTIGLKSRTELERHFGRKVHLFLFVKIASDWKEKSEFYRALGLNF